MSPTQRIITRWQESRGHLWLDVTSPDPALLAALEQAFCLDLEAFQQILDPRHRAHVKEYEDYFFLQLPLPAQPGERGGVLRRDLHAVRRALGPLRDARRDFMLLDGRNRHLFEELYARSVRLLELVANLHNLFDGIFNADLSIQNTRMNEVMKTLTVVATVMMPLTVLTGFFGMNFEHISGLHSPLAFWVTTGSRAGVAIGLFWLFNRRGWW